MQTNRRLIQNVAYANQAAAHLRRQSNPLRLTARQRAALSIQGQIPKPNVNHELQPCFNLLNHSLGDNRLFRTQLELVEKSLSLFDVQGAQVINVFTVNRNSACLGAKTRAVTASARLFTEITVQPRLDVLARRRLPSSRKIRNHSLERHPVALRVGPCRTVHQHPLNVLRYVGKRCGLAYTDVATESFYQAVIKYIHPLAALAPGVYRPALQRDGLVRHDKVRVELQYCSQPVTFGARAVWTVEAKQPRRQFRQAALRMFRACVLLAVNHFLPISIAAVLRIVAGLLYEHQQYSFSKF